MIPFTWLAATVIFFSGRLSPEAVRWAVLGCWAGFMVNIGLVLAAWSDWVAHLFETRIRGTVFGTAMFASALSGTGGGLLAGTLLKELDQPQVFAWLYVAGGVFACASIITFWLVDDPAERDETDTHRPHFSEMLARFRESLADANFRNFLVARILSSAGFCIVPLIAYHFSSVEGGAMAGDQIVRFGAATTAGSAISNLLLGRIGDRHGHRLGLIAGSIAQISALSVLLSLEGSTACLTVYFLTGIVIGSSLVSHQNMMFETCPHDQRIAHLTVGSLVLGVFTSLLPLAAGTAAKVWDMRTVFTTALCISGVALCWLLLRVKEPRVLMAEDE
jgi:MFS family permease